MCYTHMQPFSQFQVDRLRQVEGSFVTVAQAYENYQSSSTAQKCNNLDNFVRHMVEWYQVLVHQ